MRWSTTVGLRCSLCLQLSDIGPLSGFPTVVSVAVPSWEVGLTISGVDSDGLVGPELGVAPLEGSGPGGLSSSGGGWDQSPSCLVSPPGSVSEPMPSGILPSLRTNDISGPPSRMAPMDQYLPRNASVLLGDFPFLPEIKYHWSLSLLIQIPYPLQHEQVNSDLKSRTDWFRANQLSVNPTKTKYIMLSKNVTPMTDGLFLQIDNEKLEQVNSTTFLGVFIDSHLT